MNKFEKIAVLMGGLSDEREVSLRTGAAMAGALERKGYQVARVDAGRDLASVLQTLRPHAALIALHGPLGEDGCVQGMLEWLGIPYTGSGVASSALCMDKELSKRLFRGVGLPTPAWVHVTSQEIQTCMPLLQEMEQGCYVKPRASGSSVGIARAHDRESLMAALEVAGRVSSEILVEKEVRGPEVTLSILNDTPLPLIEIQPVEGFYDYLNKYTPGRTRYLVPPERVTGRKAERAVEVGMAAYRAAGCRGLARVDLMVDDAGEAWILEINTIPGMTETSLAPKAAQAAGIAFDDLVERILLGAGLETWGGGSST